MSDGKIFVRKCPVCGTLHQTADQTGKTACSTSCSATPPSLPPPPPADDTDETGEA